MCIFDLINVKQIARRWLAVHIDRTLICGLGIDRQGIFTSIEIEGKNPIRSHSPFFTIEATVLLPLPQW